MQTQLSPSALATVSRCIELDAAQTETNELALVDEMQSRRAAGLDAVPPRYVKRAETEPVAAETCTALALPLRPVLTLHKVLWQIAKHNLIANYRWPIQFHKIEISTRAETGKLSGFWPVVLLNGSPAFDAKIKAFATEKSAREAAEKRAASLEFMFIDGHRDSIDAQYINIGERGIDWDCVTETAFIEIEKAPRKMAAKVEKAPAIAPELLEVAHKLEAWANKNGVDIAAVLSGELPTSAPQLLAAVATDSPIEAAPAEIAPIEWDFEQFETAAAAIEMAPANIETPANWAAAYVANLADNATEKQLAKLEKSLEWQLAELATCADPATWQKRAKMAFDAKVR